MSVPAPLLLFQPHGTRARGIGVTATCAPRTTLAPSTPCFVLAPADAWHAARPQSLAVQSARYPSRRLIEPLHKPPLTSSTIGVFPLHPPPFGDEEEEGGGAGGKARTLEEEEETLPSPERSQATPVRPHSRFTSSPRRHNLTIRPTR